MILRRLFLLLAITLAIASPAIAQNTLVSATVTDADGTAWASGTYTFTSAAYPTVAIITGTLDSTGSFTSVSFPTNNATSSVGGRWTARICPLVTAPCFSTNVIIPGGATQSLSGNLSPPAIRIAASSQPPVTAYADAEVTGAVQGSRYFNVTDSTEHVCKALPCSSNWKSIPVSGGSASVSSLNNTCYADQQTGGDMGIKITNCIATFPSTGGTVDATGFQGSQTWSTNIWSGATVPVTLKLGALNGINVNVQQVPATRNIKIIGGGSANGAGGYTTLIVGFASGDVFAPTVAGTGFELGYISFRTSVTRTAGFVVNPAPGANWGYIHDVYLENQYGGFKLFSGGGVGLSGWHIQNVQWGVASSSLHCGSVVSIGATDNTVSSSDHFFEDFLEIGDIGIHDTPEFLLDGNTDTMKFSNIDMGYSASSTATQPIWKFQNTLGGGFPPRWIRVLNSSEEGGTGAAGADIFSIDSGVNLVFDGIYAENADHGFNITCGATCHGIKVIGSVIGNNNNGGIYVTGVQTALGLSIVGNDFFGNSKASAGTTDDINIVDGNTQWSITDNSFGQITGTIGTTNNTRNAIFLTGTLNSSNFTIWGNHTQTSKYTAGFINTVVSGSNKLIQTDEGRTIAFGGPGSSRQWFLTDPAAGHINWQLAAQENVNNGFEITPSTSSGGVTFSTPILSCVSGGCSTKFASGGALPNTAAVADLGSTALPFGNLWLGTAATNNFKFQPTVTAAARVINLWDFGANGPSTQNYPGTTILTSQYTNSTTSFTNVAGGNTIQFPVLASTTYTAECHLYYQAAATGGLNIEFTGPASPTNVIYGLDDPSSATAFNSAVATAYGTSLGVVVGTAATNFDALVSFSLINGANAGTVNLLAKSSAAVQLQIQAGSFCRIQ